MKRHLLRIITCAALLAFVASIALGAFSYGRAAQFTWGNHAKPSTLYLYSNNGRVGLLADTMYTQGFSWYTAPASSYTDPEERLGFRLWPRTTIFNSYSGDYTITGLQLPWWFVALLLGSNAALWIMIWRRHARRTYRILAGLCRHCGYDLRASPHRCPECGLEVPTDVPRNPSITKLET